MTYHSTTRRRAALRQSFQNIVAPQPRVRSAFFESLETRQLLSVAPTFTPATPSAGWYNSILRQTNKTPKPIFVGPLNPAEIAGGPDAPGLISTVEGITFDEDGANNGGVFSIPPDPNGAVGPTHLVSVVNSSIEFHTKAGVQQLSQDLQTFFAPLVPLTDTFDAKVIYDTAGGRFVVVALEMTDTTQGGASNTSRIFVAVSDDSDPNGTWRYHSINSMLNIGGLRWADFPGLGVDGSAVYITANMFSFGLTPAFAASRLWIVNKTPFYTAAGPNAATVTLHDPATAAGLPTPVASMQPAKMIGTPPANMGTFLISNSTFFGVNEAISVIRVLNPITAPAFSNTFVSLGDVNNETVAFPDAPQSSSATLVDAGNSLTLDAVWRSNALYVANSVNPKAAVDAVNAGQATAHWTKINANGVIAPTLADQGNIGGEELGAGTHTFFPSIAVNSVGDVAIGMAASNATIFPGAYYTARGNGAPAGTVQPLGTLAAGLGPYVRTFGGTSNRWGDYSSTVNDPADDTFWIFNEYADTPGTPTNPPPEDGRWRTRWGNFSMTGVVPAIPGVPDLLPSSDSGMFDNDDVTNDNTPTFIGTGTNGLTIKILANGLQVGTGVVSGGFYLITTTAITPDGLKNITAVQSDGINDSAPSAALPVTIDTIAPTIVNGNPEFNFLGPTAVHRLIYFFSEGVNPSLTNADLTVTRLPATNEPTALTYPGGLNAAIFTFPSAQNGSLVGFLPDGNYTATLSAAGVTDLAGNPLAANNDYPFFFLQADANHDRNVNVTDFSILAGNFNTTGKNFAQGNFNYDGLVNVTDFSILASRFNTQLPPAAPTIVSTSRGAAPKLPTSPFAAGIRIWTDRAPEDDALRQLLA